MPLYEYECPACKKEFVREHKISEQPVVECKRCHEVAKRIISQSSFHLSGTGWARDNYR